MNNKELIICAIITTILFIAIKLLQKLCRYILFGRKVIIDEYGYISRLDIFLQIILPLIIFIVYGRFWLSDDNIDIEYNKYWENKDIEGKESEHK